MQCPGEAPADTQGLLPRKSPTPHTPPLLAGLLVVGVLFELTQEPALLELHVEALDGRVDGLVLLHDHINQIDQSSKSCIMAYSRSS